MTIRRPLITNTGVLGELPIGDQLLCDTLGINTGANTTAAKLSISDGNAVNAALLSTDYVVTSAQSTAPGLSIVAASSNSAHRGVFKGVRSRGTLDTPLALTTNDQTLSFLGAIYDGVTVQATAAIDFKVDGAVSSGVAPQRISFVTSETTGAARTEKLIIKASGNVGIGNTAPTAALHIKAGTTTASSAPLKLTSGDLLTSPEAGAIEFLTDAFYATITTGATRKTIAFLESPSFTTPSLGTPSSGTLTNCTFPTLNQNTSGTAAKATILETTRAIYGNNFNGSADLSQIITSTYGGTGNGFIKFIGPTTSEKTFTLPDSNQTLLYSGGALGTPSSGTVTNLTGTAAININGTVGATTATSGVFTTATANSFIPNSSTIPSVGMYLSAANTLNLSVNTTKRFEIGSAGNIGIGGSSSSIIGVNSTLSLTGGTTAYGYVQSSSVLSDVTATAYSYRSSLGTQAASFTCASLIHYGASQGTIGAGSAVTTQVGFSALSSITGATNNYGFQGAIAAATGRYNLYMSGTAANYLAGDMQFAKTITTGGTTGAQTINKTTGTVNFAATATSLVVTNSLVATTSIIICTVGTNDSTMKSVQAVAASGSFTLYANAAATAETRVNFLVTN